METFIQLVASAFILICLFVFIKAVGLIGK
jgi:hypothetical protein